MELTATRTFGVRKAILWLKVSQDQHSQLQVIATRGDSFLMICNYVPYNNALVLCSARWHVFAQFILTIAEEHISSI